MSNRAKKYFGAYIDARGSVYIKWVALRFVLNGSDFVLIISKFEDILGMRIVVGLEGKKKCCFTSKNYYSGGYFMHS